MSLRTKCLIATLLTVTAVWAVTAHGACFAAIGVLGFALIWSATDDEQPNDDALVSYRYPGGDQ